jgi:polyhydroxybutyrate depolymerase
MPIKLILSVTTLLVFTNAAARAETKMMTWTIDGLKRDAIVYLPTAKSPGGKTPVVFSFHGHGDDIQNFQSVDLQAAWPEAIVAYFQGLPTSRSGEPPLPGWQVETGTYGDRDLKLVDAALASLRKQYSVDDARIYATGFSNGANFTYLLWSERPNVFAAYAPVAAVLRSSPKTPRPVLHIAGSRDRQIPFDNQKEAMELARMINRAAGKGEACGSGCTLYNPSSSPGAPVMTWIHSGGHEYPDGTSQRIVKFFKQHPMNGHGT